MMNREGTVHKNISFSDLRLPQGTLGIESQNGGESKGLSGECFHQIPILGCLAFWVSLPLSFRCFLGSPPPPKKLLVLNSLSQFQLLEEPKLRQCPAGPGLGFSK